MRCGILDNANSSYTEAADGNWRAAMNATEVLRTDQSWIQKRPDVCGGDACIRDTRIPVWSVAVARRTGASESELLRYFVTPLSPADVQAAVAYAQQHPNEIEEAIRLNEEA